MFRAGLHARFGVLPRQGKRFFGKHVLAGFGGGDDLLGVLRVRRRQHDGVDARIGQHLAVIVVERKILLFRVVHGFLERARDAGDDADLVAFALDAVDEVLSPAAEADDGCVDHWRPFKWDLSYCE